MFGQIGGAMELIWVMGTVLTGLAIMVALGQIHAASNAAQAATRVTTRPPSTASRRETPSGTDD